MNILANYLGDAEFGTDTYIVPVETRAGIGICGNRTSPCAH
jgi:hypothetical protein